VTGPTGKCTIQASIPAHFLPQLLLSQAGVGLDESAQGVCRSAQLDLARPARRDRREVVEGRSDNVRQHCLPVSV
jgi:hypothetical protein